MKLTVPNCLTLFRLLLVPVVAVVFLSGNAGVALILFIVAGATDLLDGYIARKTNTATHFGQVADPLADKLMTIVTLVTLSIAGNLPWHFFAIYVVKEGILLAGSISVLVRNLSGQMKGVEVKAQLVGKIAAALAFTGIALSFFPKATYPWNEIILWAGIVAGIVTIIRYVGYARKFKDV